MMNGRDVQAVEDPCETALDGRAAYSDGKTRKGWPFVVIDSRDGREIHLVDVEHALLRLIRVGYRLKTLGSDAEPTWLWADAAAGAEPGQLRATLAVTLVSRQPVVTWPQPPLTGLLLTARRDGACFTWSLGVAANHVAQGCAAPPFVSNTGDYWIRDDSAWQIPAGTNTLRWIQPYDGSERLHVDFEPPRRFAALRAAAQIGQFWLTEWLDLGLFLHDHDGNLLNRLPRQEGELLFADDREGVYFVRWEDGRPVELRLVRVSVHWTR